MNESRVARQAYADIAGARGRGRLPEGAAEGLQAGVIVAVIAAALAALEGSGAGYPAKLAAGVWLGTPALISGAGGVAAGCATHLAVSAELGRLFVWWARPTLSRPSVWVAGLAFGAAAWLFATYAALPLIDPTMRVRVAIVPGSWLSLHLLFGLALARAARTGCPPTDRPDSASAAGSEAGSSAER